MPHFRSSLPAKTVQTAEGGAREILENSEKIMGMIPNMYANMANSPGLLSTYTEGYKRFREHSGFTPAEQEVVFLTISRHNGCTYCMAAHSMMAEKGSGVPGEDLQALRDGALLVDDKLKVLNEFTRHMLESQGRPEAGAVEGFLAAGYEEKQILEIVLAMAVKLLSNYSNHLFETAVDEAFSAYAWPSND